MLFGLWCDAVDGGECGRGDCPKMGMKESRGGLKLESVSPERRVTPWPRPSTADVA